MHEYCLNLVGKKIQFPTLWFGHDLKHPIDVWTHLPEIPGIMLNAYQIYKNRFFYENAQQIGLKKMLNFEGPIFIDSGGFLFQNDGKAKISPSQVVSIYKNLKPDLAAVLDIPLNPLLSKDSNYRRWRMTLKNTEIMNESCRESDFYLTPVFHAYTIRQVVKRFERLKKIVTKPEVLCLGSLVPLLKASYIGEWFSNRKGSPPRTILRWDVISQVVLTLRKLYPTTILHAFGVGSLSTMYFLFLLGVDSIDSVSWRLKAAFGEIILPGSSNRVLAHKENRARTRKRLNQRDLNHLEQCRCPVCKEKSISEKIAALSQSFRARAIHNAHVLLGEFHKIRNHKKNKCLSQFIQQRLEQSELPRRILNESILKNLSKFNL